MGKKWQPRIGRHKAAVRGEILREVLRPVFRYRHGFIAGAFIIA